MRYSYEVSNLMSKMAMVMIWILTNPLGALIVHVSLPTKSGCKAKHFFV